MKEKTPETTIEQIARVEMMANDPGMSWDLSDNDLAALRTVLSQRSELLAALKAAWAECDKEQGADVVGVLGRLGLPAIRKAEGRLT